MYKYFLLPTIMAYAPQGVYLGSKTLLGYKADMSVVINQSKISAMEVKAGGASQWKCKYPEYPDCPEYKYKDGVVNFEGENYESLKEELSEVRISLGWVNVDEDKNEIKVKAWKYGLIPITIRLEFKGVLCTATKSKDCLCGGDYETRCDAEETCDDYLAATGNCSPVDPCQPNPCQNGGSCANMFGTAVCTCGVGYVGDICETASTSIGCTWSGNLNECLADFKKVNTGEVCPIEYQDTKTEEDCEAYKLWAEKAGESLQMGTPIEWNNNGVPKGCFVLEKKKIILNTMDMDNRTSKFDEFEKICKHERCVPYSKEACIAAAENAGLHLGAPGKDDFEGPYGTKGCYKYESGEYAGQAYYGTGGKSYQMKKDPTYSDQQRVTGYDCSTNFQVLDAGATRCPDGYEDARWAGSHEGSGCKGAAWQLLSQNATILTSSSVPEGCYKVKNDNGDLDVIYYSYDNEGSTTTSKDMSRICRALPCDDAFCTSHGTCSGAGPSRSCACRDGFAGTNCEKELGVCSQEWAFKQKCEEKNCTYSRSKRFCVPGCSQDWASEKRCERHCTYSSRRGFCIRKSR